MWAGVGGGLAEEDEFRELGDGVEGVGEEVVVGIGFLLLMLLEKGGLNGISRKL